MSKKTIALLVLLIIAPVIAYFLWPSDEARIRKLFREGARAIHEEKIDDVMKQVSLTYRDDYGMTYLYIREGMERFFTMFDKIEADYEIKQISIQEKTAVAELVVRVLATRGQETGYIAGDLSNPLQMRFHLEKERGSWSVNKVEGLPFGF